jgi:regulator of PEP synthase PpsR (kinase-PPPase family)
MTLTRTAFFISDRTGITAEMLGHSLLTQFEHVSFNEITLPFVDSPEKARETAHLIAETADKDGVRPLIFSTLVDKDLSGIIQAANGFYIDCFQCSSHRWRRNWARSPPTQWADRTACATTIIISTASRRSISRYRTTMAKRPRSWSRPMSSWWAYPAAARRQPVCTWRCSSASRAANYPLIPEDFEAKRLPSALREHSSKMFGLTIRADRLQRIRHERRPGSTYSSMANCEYEIREAEILMRAEGISILDTTTRSIEELATTILQKANLQRHVY